MNPSIVVLADLTATAERIAAYAAALGAPLHAQLTLLHLYEDPVLDPELTPLSAALADRNQAQTGRVLRELTGRLPAATELIVAVGTMPDTVAKAIRHYDPLLLVMGLSAEEDMLDYWLRNQALPVLRATHRPLLLVPAAAPATGVPRRVLLAVDAEPFTPNAAARNLAPLLRAWQATYTVAHATAPEERQAFPGQRALGQVRRSGLLPPAEPLELYEQQLAPAAGILQAITDTQADLLVLVARPRSFLGGLFHRSVTAQVLRRTQVPVLLLPADAPELPGWLPAMS